MIFTPYEMGLAISVGIIIGFALHGVCRMMFIRK